MIIVAVWIVLTGGFYRQARRRVYLSAWESSTFESDVPVCGRPFACACAPAEGGADEGVAEA